ncbi:zinc finger (CCCH type) protein, putative [Eimeria maxima]|uniref:Zinc finger (CCCH type) protein, putative n=1 Tax=Eimeria maxima TaxID=5804 RepID=U6M8I3_EIMMA|nr:zinc finger (CCCH type) protein, putative [Eimeria maxima]CDJ59373.1 zinc finger (CCCH type) protein, putative [Eimeria maxima]
MFVKRSAPKGVRKRPNPSDAAADQQGETAAAPAAPGGAAGTEGEAISAAAATAAAARSDGSDEEHAKIARRKQPRTNICKHFLVGRTKTKASEREKITNALAQESNPDLVRKGGEI